MSKVFIGTGRRKSSIAQVKMVPGTGKITVNGRDVRDFFPYETNVMDLKQPLVATNNEETFDIEVLEDLTDTNEVLEPENNVEENTIEKLKKYL